MSSPTNFNDLLDAVEHLSPEEQAELVGVVQRRLAERGRRRVVNDAKEATDEFNAGAARPASADDLMREIDP